MKRKNRAVLLGLALCLSLVGTAAAAAPAVTQPYMTWLTRTYQPGYYRPLPGGNMQVYTMDGYYGVVPRNNLEQPLSARYVQWIDVSPALAVVSDGDKWGGPAAYGVLRKSDGVLTVPCQYVSFSATDGQRVYLSDGVSGVTVDSTGMVLGALSDKEFAAIKWGTHQMPKQTQGLIPISENGKHGYLSPSGGILVPPLYDNISVVGKDGGYFLAQKDQTWGIFDRAGKVIFPFLFPNTWYVEETGDIYAIHGGFLGIAHPSDYLSWSHYAGQTVPMGPAAGQETVPPVENPVLCDGSPVKLGAYLFHDGKGGVNYVKLRDVAHLLAEKPCRFAVNWTAAEGITLSRGTPYSPVGGEGVPPSGGKQPYRYNRAPLTIDGTAVLLDSYVIGQNTYFKLRDLGNALGFTVGWSAQTGVTIATAGAGGR